MHHGVQKKNGDFATFLLLHTAATLPAVRDSLSNSKSCSPRIGDGDREGARDESGVVSGEVVHDELDDIT